MSSVHDSHDRGAKLLLGHPRVVKDLLHAFVPPEWLRDVDLNALHPLPTERLGPDLVRRIGDIVWEAPHMGGEGGLVVMIEAQSTVDRAMAPRMTTLAAMYYEEQVRRHSGAPVPQMLPIVYYTGRAPWNAAIAISDMIAWKSPELPFVHRPCYFLIQARHLVE